MKDGNVVTRPNLVIVEVRNPEVRPSTPVMEDAGDGVRSKLQECINGDRIPFEQYLLAQSQSRIDPVCDPPKR
jgi:hypothetical protein